MSKPCVIIGGGGHASVLCDVLLDQGREVRAFVGSCEHLARDIFSGIPQIPNDEEAFQLDVNEVVLINGIGVLPNSPLRETIANKYKEKGFVFDRVIATSAYVSPFAKLSSGVQVLHGAIVQVGAVINEDTIINTNTSIDHDCVVGKYNHIAPGAVLCGEVKTKDSVFIGANSIIAQGVSICEFTIVGAGAIVTKSIDKRAIVYPAKSIVKGEI